MRNGASIFPSRSRISTFPRRWPGNPASCSPPRGNSTGSRANPLLTGNTPGIHLNKWGNIVADPVTGATNLPGVYAGGDIVTGAATVIEAMGAGKRAARAIDAYLSGRPASPAYN